MQIKGPRIFWKIVHMVNKQSEQYAVYERLDRGMATIEWMELMPHIGVIHMESDRSDYVPIKVTNIP